MARSFSATVGADSLATAIRRAYAETTRIPVRGVRRFQARYAAPTHVSSRLGQGNTPRQALAQYSAGFGMGMGAGGTSITTPPNFYTPFTTPQSFQIPNNRKEEYLWAEWFAKNEPKVAAGIEFYSDFPVSEFTLECGNPHVKDFYHKLVKKLNFTKWLPLISQEYHLRGDVFIMASIDCPKCHGSNLVGKRKQRCDHAGAQWGSISILNPDMVEVSMAMLDQEPEYYFNPTDDMVKIVQEKKPKYIYDNLPDVVKQACLSKQQIKLSSESIWHLKRGAAPWAQYGTSIVRRLFQTLTYKDKLRQAQWQVAERHILPIRIVKVGSEERPASPEDLEAVQAELAAVANDPLLTLVTHHAFEYVVEGSSGKVLQLTNEYELIEQDIIDGLMLNKAIINGDGPSYSNAQVGLITMAKRLERFRTELAFWIEERIFKPVAEWNGFIDTGDRGVEEYVYPTIKWGDLQLRDNTGTLQMLVQAQQNGIISAQTLIEAFDLDYDQEVERLRMEQAGTMANAPGITAGEGAPGMGGGMPPMPGGGPGGGAPPMDLGGGAPGAPPIDLGGGAPGGEGAPGGAPMGGMPPAPPMGAMASPQEARQNYRLAAAQGNKIHDDCLKPYEEKMKVRTASRAPRSDMELAFLESLKPVTGRSVLGPLPAITDDEEPPLPPLYAPYLGGLTAHPCNAEAHLLDRLTAVDHPNLRVAAPGAAGAQQRPNLFTSWEQKLYQLVLRANIPLAFYAQYQAGPDAQTYTLDGAFPQVKIGVEADSKTFHSNPENIARDRRRDMELASGGWLILRFTEQELERFPDQVVKVIYDAVRARLGGGQQAGAQAAGTKAAPL